MKTKCICFFLGVLSAVLAVCGINFFTSYEKNVSQMKNTAIKYQGAYVETALSSDAADYLTEGKKTYYFGKLPDADQAIEINSPNRATLYVYPKDENSLLIRYEPRGGIVRTYVKSDYGDFNRLLKALYELTEHESFNKTVEY